MSHTAPLLFVGLPSPFEKPAVVFFGENVPRAVVEEAMSHTLSSDGVLVIGSSLMVYSGTAMWSPC
jgi:NAD-dependent SIR2 family protein deacetylase